MSMYHVKVSDTTNKNFQEALLSSLMEDSDNEEEVCLITGEPLANYPKTEQYALQCGHVFLKHAIYKEVCQQKAKTEHTVNKYRTRLYINELQCPYCRNVQRTILPQWPSYPLVLGVNSPNKYCTLSNTCTYVFSRGKRKGTTCAKPCEDVYCSTHTKPTNTETNAVAVLVDVLSTPPAPSQKVFLEDMSTLTTYPIKRRCQAVLSSGKRKHEQCNALTRMCFIVDGRVQMCCGRHNKKHQAFFLGVSGH